MSASDTPATEGIGRGSSGGSVSLEQICKSYGGTQVLHGVSLDFAAGEVHGLVGENGAGKSTLMKVLTGVVRPNSGRVRIDGDWVSIRTPAEALAHRLTIISQELATVPARTVLENVFLGSWAHRGGWLTTRADRRRYTDLCTQVGFELDPDALVGGLTIAQQQQVEILRAVSRGARLIVMDEPTAVLSQSETEALMALIRRLAADGVSVVLVSHFLEEVLGVCDTVTVLRDGRHILTEPAEQHTPATLVSAMAGRVVDILYPEIAPVPPEAPVVLEVSGLSRGHLVRGVDLQVRAGEIVGLAGLVGSGRSELARLIFGADRADGGQVHLKGAQIRATTPAVAMHAGIGMVPESRKDQGLHLNSSVRDNVTMAALQRVSRRGIRSRRAEKTLAGEATSRLDVRGADLEGQVWTLSGGNQQKVLFAKWIARAPQVLIIDEPTRGVDVGAKAEIHRLVADLAAAGTAVLLISSEIEEVLGLSHRVIVLRQGRVSATFPAKQTTPEEVLAAAFADKEALT